MPTVLSALQKLGGGSVTYGGVGVDENNLCNVSYYDPSLIEAAVAAAKDGESDIPFQP